MAITLLASEFKPQIQLLATVPCITSKSSTTIISETGVDTSAFEDAKHLCS
jgi:hypothetical protein